MRRHGGGPLSPRPHAPVSLMGDHLAVRDVGASALQDYRRDADRARAEIENGLLHSTAKVLVHEDQRS